MENRRYCYDCDTGISDDLAENLLGAAMNDSTPSSPTIARISRCRPSSPKAFTLVEVLVVIGIVCLVMAVLLPAICKVRDGAQLAACAGNLRRIGQATMIYCTDNHGALPERAEGRNGVMGGFRENPGEVNIEEVGVYRSLEYRNVNDPENATAFRTHWKDPGANIGRLIVAGYMGNIDLVGPPYNATTNPNGSKAPSDFARARNDVTIAPFRFCPGQLDLGIQLAQPWMTSYYFNPHWANLMGSHPPVFTGPALGYSFTGDSGQEVTAYQKIGQFPSWAALACDSIYFGKTPAHVRDCGRSAIWNLLFIDGSVRPIRDKWVIGDISHLGRGASFGFMQLDDFLDILETEEMDRDPVFTIACPGQAANTFGKGEFPASYREGDYHSTLFLPED
jgi:prepilin-type N-terminal cleavage/methylation domain-containing protein